MSPGNVGQADVQGVSLHEATEGTPLSMWIKRRFLLKAAATQFCFVLLTGKRALELGM
jgi:hypothetical protein